VSITRGSWTNPRKWGNPHRLRSRDPLDEVECLLAHARHIEESGLVDDIEELRGEVLGCVCEPERCHGHTLARLADADDPHAELVAIIEEFEKERRDLLNAHGGVQAGLFGEAGS
jgi:hypothetical protein